MFTCHTCLIFLLLFKNILVTLFYSVDSIIIKVFAFRFVKLLCFVSKLQKPNTPLTSLRRRRRMLMKTRIMSHQLHQSTPTRKTSALHRITMMRMMMKMMTYFLLNQQSCRMCIFHALILFFCFSQLSKILVPF